MMPHHCVIGDWTVFASDWPTQRDYVAQINFNAWCEFDHASLLELVQNLKAHGQKPDFVFRLNGRVHLNRWGSQFSRLLAAEVCALAVVILDTPPSEVMWEYWLPTPFASFPFTSPPMRHRVPPHSERSIIRANKMPTRCNRWFFIAKLTVRSTCFGHNYAHHQELKSIIQVVAARGTWCFGLQVVGLMWSCRLCVWFAGCWPDT